MVPGEGEVKLLEWIYQNIPTQTATTTNTTTTLTPNNSNQPQQRPEPPNRKSPTTSIVLVGGDSDLFVEALVVPIMYTPNIYVLLPESRKNNNNKNQQQQQPQYLVIELWETTQTLHQMILSDDTNFTASITTSITDTGSSGISNSCSSNSLSTPTSNIREESTMMNSNTNIKFMKMMNGIRSDLALLLMMNGNNYLRKMRGSSGFQSFIPYLH
jgi:hypothetical protein